MLVPVVFAALAILTGAFGTLFQVFGAWLNANAGPRESPVAAMLVGPAGTAAQDIAILDRQAVAIAAAGLGNVGASALFAALLAGVAISFPEQWIAGLIAWFVGLLTTVAVARPLWRRIVQLRERQEMLRDTRFGEAAEELEHELARKPDLETSISSMAGLARSLFLVRCLKTAVLRERARQG